MDINQEFTKVDDVSQDLLDVFLEPYKENCKYLQKAQIQYPPTNHSLDKTKSHNQGLWFIKANFFIPESCYITDTGHFNSVEFNICYNQLFYILIAYLVDNNLLEVMKDWDLEIYKRRQLSDILIVHFSSTFKKPINSKSFQGTLSINKASARSELIMLKTSCAFYDNNGGLSQGDVTIAILNRQSEQILNGDRESVVA
ncbi:MAG: hypothetical protein F6K31_08925 [Symploca sp. SIO2G7]|nr:hypothetical protein [Symploca sp. SIO2G7]